MKNGWMQCKDLPDDLILQAIENVKSNRHIPEDWQLEGIPEYGVSSHVRSLYWAPVSYIRWGIYPGVNPAQAWDQFHKMRPHVPISLFAAKVFSLYRRGFIHGDMSRIHTHEQCYRVKWIKSYNKPEDDHLPHWEDVRSTPALRKGRCYFGSLTYGN